MDFYFIQWVVICNYHNFNVQIIPHLASWSPFKLAPVWGVYLGDSIPWWIGWAMGEKEEEAGVDFFSIYLWPGTGDKAVIKADRSPCSPGPHKWCHFLGSGDWCRDDSDFRSGRSGVMFWTGLRGKVVDKSGCPVPSPPSCCYPTSPCKFSLFFFTQQPGRCRLH